ncbi:divalent metal cation transporter [Endozoicomonas sp. SESOKO1]|uniref:divalent metal cation transporter n=1 Tax=Endozoicomonas sp. SESOKO1 TaxID=2828742 RepID=UPI0021497F21|nr:divalent metal cation transporter [Endozoicomonas sp. SESOKO1]
MSALILAIGPGITVMLADTDAGSIVTAAQSGAQWGYRLVLLNVILIPILYFVQELTARLGMTTGKGHGLLIKERFGTFWAYISIITLFMIIHTGFSFPLTVWEKVTILSIYIVVCGIATVMMTL